MLDGWLLMILRALFFSLMETKVRYLGHIIRNELCNNDDDDVQCTSTLKHLSLELAVFVLKANASGGMWWHFEDLAQASKMNKWSLSIYNYTVPNCNAMLSYCLYKHTCRSDSKNTAYALTGTRYSSCPWKHCKHCPFVQWSHFCIAVFILLLFVYWDASEVKFPYLKFLKKSRIFQLRLQQESAVTLNVMWEHVELWQFESHLPKEWERKKLFKKIV